MNSEPPTGDELARLLVTMKQNVLERTTESPRRKRHRNLGLGLGLAALLAIGGGSGALALGMLPSPFPASAPAAPTSTPTPTPTATRTATPRPTPTVAPVLVPQPALPIDCATLASGVRMDLFIPSAVQGRVDLLNPIDASLVEAGVRSCEWGSGEQPYSIGTVKVSPDRERGLGAVGAMLASGARQGGAGEASAMTCTAQGCEATVVSGTWWLEFFTFDVDATDETVSVETRAANASAALSSMAGQLDGVSPARGWTRPASSWSSVDACSALAPAVPLADVLQSPGLEGPRELQVEYPSAITRAADRTVQCDWYAAPSEGATNPPITGVTAMVSSGSGWAVDQVDSMAQLERSPVTVAGADEAEYVCVYGEGSSCFVNVLTDDSWLQVGAGNVYGESLEGQLVAVAEAIVATRPAN
ncbi:hypothetical protein ITJ55_07385 [Frigoribacterium sp. VKM Ac-1396]|uniref:hypothetical protein n=1 Tax=Frigoribacterium sp. VKM Ac-1396 TaxID=2783821 RepID=UPI001889D68D|nr:hypothetical protein [Frigoribacterium sp. VKM Ac-1396]MBF4600629.1 hypothetical protein [Frigoribacterium sp. VKM Ac-1396]